MQGTGEHEPLPSAKKADGPRAGLRVLELIEQLAQRKDGVPISDLSQSLGLPRASLHRLLRMLERVGFVNYRAGGYGLGDRSFRLARLIGTYAASSDLLHVARPVMRDLCDKTRETVILAVLSTSRQEMVYADVLIVDSPLRYAVPAGDRQPLYSSASGKAVLAFFSATELDAYKAQIDFAPLTRFTTRKQDLDAILEGLRVGGTVVDEGGQHVGALAVASPVFDARGEVFGAIVAAGPSDRLGARLDSVRESVRQAGRSISRSLDFAGHYPGDG